MSEPAKGQPNIVETLLEMADELRHLYDPTQQSQFARSEDDSRTLDEAIGRLSERLRPDDSPATVPLYPTFTVMPKACATCGSKRLMHHRYTNYVEFSDRVSCQKCGYTVVRQGKCARID